MTKTNIYSEYGVFKEEYIRRSISSIYEFNGIQSFIDILNGEMHNTAKISFKAYYVFPEDDEKSNWIWDKTMTRIW